MTIDINTNTPKDNSSEEQTYKSHVEAVKRMTHAKIERHRLRVRRCRMTLSAAACLFVAVVGVMCWQQQSTTTKQPVAKVVVKKPVQWITERISADTTTTITLSDGTRIMASAGSEVIYPSEWFGGKRIVRLHGNACFDVAHDSHHPFIVEAGGFSVKVLGTCFSISNFNPNSSRVVLVRGSVKVSLGHNGSIAMRPNQQLTVTRSGKARLSEIDAGSYMSWTTGKMQLDGENIKDVISRIKELTGQKVVVTSPLPEDPLYGKLDLSGNAYDILKRLEIPAGIRVRHKAGRTLVSAE